MKRILVSAAVLLFCAVGDAQAECAAPYTPEQMGADLGAMSEALRGSDREAFRQVGESMIDRLPCVDAPLAPVVLANVYRYAGLSKYFGGNQGRAEAWFRTALELDSSFDWDVKEVGINDPLRMVFEGQREVAGAEKVDAGGGQSLVVPEGGRLVSDGRALTTAKLTTDRPHLIQWIQKSDNSVVKVWIVEGAELPAELLGEAPASEDVAGGKSSYAVQRVERSRPPMKTPTIIAGGVSFAGGLALYIASHGANKQFEKAGTTAELERTRSLSNGLVLGAVGGLALGSGLTYVGVMLDGGTGIRLGRTF